MKNIFLLLLGWLALAACSQRGAGSGEVIFETDFQQMDSSNWVIESETGTSWNELVGDGYMDINAAKGITVWFDEKLERDVAIEFEVTVVDKGGPNDRVSDLNVFWMASDPENPDEFFARSEWREGIFWRYYTLNQYYVGLGGHDNTKTRFRKYHGSADPMPEVIKEYTQPEYLITPNKKSTIKIVCLEDKTQYFYNGQMLYELEESNPYDNGYFGFRTVNSHMQIHSFKVYGL